MLSCSKGPAQVWTLEYGHFTSEYPGHTVIRPAEFRKQFLAGSLPAFHAVFSYSSLEHSGLGRYGDPLNPWGDILTVAEAWCAAGPSAQLAIAVPTAVTTGQAAAAISGKSDIIGARESDEYKIQFLVRSASHPCDIASAFRTRQHLTLLGSTDRYSTPSSLQTGSSSGQLKVNTGWEGNLTLTIRRAEAARRPASNSSGGWDFQPVFVFNKTNII